MAPSGGHILSGHAERIWKERRAQGGHFRLCPPWESPRTDQRGPTDPFGNPRASDARAPTEGNPAAERRFRPRELSSGSTRTTSAFGGIQRGQAAPSGRRGRGVRGETPSKGFPPWCPFFPASFRQGKEAGPRRERQKKGAVGRTAPYTVLFFPPRCAGLSRPARR